MNTIYRVRGFHKGPFIAAFVVLGVLLWCILLGIAFGTALDLFQHGRSEHGWDLEPARTVWQLLGILLGPTK